jgi:glycyl-tRNA synthetase beta chain
MTTKNLLVELFVEELPPKALKKLGEAFANGVFAYLQKDGFLSDSSTSTAFASPRRLAVHITAVKEESDGKAYRQKWMPTSVAFDKQGDPSPALTKRLQKEYSPEIDVQSILKTDFEKSADEKGIETLFQNINVAGRSIARGLQDGLQDAIAKLPIPKVMSYQLDSNSGCELPGWSSVSFVRPAHSLLALHGSDVVGVRALGLRAGNRTQGHRFEAAKSEVLIADADAYAQTLETDGAVIASFDARKAEIAKQLAAAAAKVGGGCKPIEDDVLLDEVTALVERPNVLVCEFEKQFLDVPQECLILTMKANQKYFPLLDVGGKLTNKFLVVSNIRPDDASAVIQGNERVVRPRLADAKFFFDQDRKKTLESRVEGLDKVIYHNKLGTQGERVKRVRAIARVIGEQLGGEVLAKAADTAARLAKTDLLTDMVGEFPELQGIMGGYYARHDGLTEDIAFAIEDHYKPRFAGDALPRNPVGIVVALADKLETLVGMFGIGNLPTGDKDPFALRRHALGVIRMLVEKDLPIGVYQLIEIGEAVLPNQAAVLDALAEFIYERLAGSLREQSYSAQEVDAVVSQRPQRLSDVPKRLAAVRAFASLPEAPALAAANKRVGNILKKAEGAVEAKIDPALLKEPAETALANALKFVAPSADAALASGNYTANLQALAALKAPVDEFFDKVMVNADDPALKANRLGLLATLHAAMNRVADLSKLAS